MRSTLSFKNILMLFAFLLSIMMLSSHLIVWKFDRDQKISYKQNNFNYENIINMKDIRFHIVQIQQFMTDSSVIGSMDISEATNEYKLAKNQLQLLSSSNPSLKTKITKINQELDTLYNTGTKMVSAYVTSGRDAGNIIMKDPTDGFDKHADKLTSSLDEITALLNQSISQSKISLGNNENMVTYINVFMSLLSLSIVLISNYFLGRYILNVIGGEPTLASNIVKDVAAGNLKNDVGMNSPRKSIMFHLRSMIDTLSIQMHDIHKVSKQIAVSSFQITEMSQDISNSSNVQRNKSKDVMIATELLKETFLPFSAKSFVLQVGDG